MSRVRHQHWCSNTHDCPFVQSPLRAVKAPATMGRCAGPATRLVELTARMAHQSAFQTISLGLRDSRIHRFFTNPCWSSTQQDSGTGFFACEHGKPVRRSSLLTARLAATGFLDSRKSCKSLEILLYVVGFRPDLDDHKKLTTRGNCWSWPNCR